MGVTPPREKRTKVQPCCSHFQPSARISFIFFSMPDLIQHHNSTMTKSHLRLCCVFATTFLPASIVGAIPTPDDFYVKGLEDIEPVYALFDGDMYAGLIPTRLYGDVDDDTGEYMFRLFVPRQTAYTDSLVTWLNGGPGCSSLAGGMAENMPIGDPTAPSGFYGIDGNAPFVYNPYSWTNATTMLYVEHPHGTGFSRGPQPANEEEASRDFYYFLQNLIDVFGYRQQRLIIFGESYAGMYVPSIAHYIFHENLKLKKKKTKKQNDLHINLWGIALGNGWADATIQGPAVIDYAWWHGMIDSVTREALHREWEYCRPGSPTANHKQPEPFHKFTTPDECGLMGATLAAAGAGVVDWGAPNGYDVTTFDPYPNLMSPTSTKARFYNDPRVQDALHVTPYQHWYACIPGAGRRRRRLDETDLSPGQLLLRHDEPIGVGPYIADLLDNAPDTRVLIYNGDRDLTTNAVGSEMLLNQMEWSGAKGWQDPDQYQRGLWIPFHHTIGGWIKQYKGLEFLVLYNSGHLAPMNIPDVALDLVTRFVANKTYLDEVIPKTNAPPVEALQSNRQDLVSWLFALLFAAIGFAAGVFLTRTNKREEYDAVPDSEILME